MIALFLREGRQQVFDYMPDNQEIHRVSKQWICNVCFTILEDEFSDWVKAQVEVRNEHVTSKKNVMIAMDPAVAEVFRSSTKVSCK